MGEENSTLDNSPQITIFLFLTKGPQDSNFNYLLHAQGLPLFSAILRFATSAVIPLFLELSAHQTEIGSF